MVTWGTNQVYTVPAAAGSAPAAGAAPTPASSFSFAAPAPSTGVGSTPAPGPSLFGSAGTPAPAPAASGGLFGSSTQAPGASGLFGSTAPTAAPSGGLFGSTTPAAAPSGGLFGSSFTSSPAPSGLFGSSFTSSPAPGGLFGSTTPAAAPSGGLFGSTATTPGGLFGTAAGTPVAAGPQIPAHAAMQAHMDASARQEAAKLQAALEKLHAAYTGAPTLTDSKHNFVSIFYDDISPQHQQVQALMGGQRVPPPKPPHVSEKEWLDAVARNPDPNAYMPVESVGAEALQARLVRAQDRANTLSKSMDTLKECREKLALSGSRSQSDLLTLNRAYVTLRTQLLAVMRKVELLRNMNLPRQADEAVLNHRLYEALKQVDQLQKLLEAVQAKAKAQSQTQAGQVVNVPDERELARVFNGHRLSLTDMAEMMEKDSRDVNLLKHHVVPKVPAPPR